MHCNWEECEINIIDTPGYADFIRDTVPALVASETVLIVISAMNGIQVNTEKHWDLVCQKGLGKLIVVMMIDGENINFHVLLQHCPVRKLRNPGIKKNEKKIVF